MIYTVTFNPAIDYVVHMSDELLAGMTNRTLSEECYFGGKGSMFQPFLRTLAMTALPWDLWRASPEAPLKKV